MPILQSKTIEYKFSLEDMQKLIASDLNVPVEKIEVEYVIREVGGDFMDRYGGTPTVTEIIVTVDETK